MKSGLSHDVRRVKRTPWQLEYQHMRDPRMGGPEWMKSINDTSRLVFAEKLRFLYLLSFSNKAQSEYRLRNTVTSMTLSYRSIWCIVGHDTKSPTRNSLGETV